MAGDTSGTSTSTDSGSESGTETGDGDGDPGDGDGDPSGPPEATTLSLTFAPIKQFEFTWPAAPGATVYELWERLEADGEYAQIGPDTTELSLALTVPLHLRRGASYFLRACNDDGCADSEPVDVLASMTAAVGYVKAQEPEANDGFGVQIALSGDGDTLVVAAPGEDGGAAGIDGDETNNSRPNSGAVYVFVRDPSNSTWTQEAYVKASNADTDDAFGTSVAVSHSGDTLVVGAPLEDSNAQAVDGSQDNALLGGEFGAAYVFVRDPTTRTWAQDSYLKAANANMGDEFGNSVAVSAEGDTIVVGAFEEDSASTSINNNAGNNNAAGAGAAYVFVRDAMTRSWVQEAYIKAPNTNGNDAFGSALALSGDGNTLAVSAIDEDSAATGVDGNQDNNTASNAGAVYVFFRRGNLWALQGYIKASNTDPSDQFGVSVALSYSGQDLVVGAERESSAATGVDGDQLDDSAINAGAAYLFLRDSNTMQWSQRAYFKASNAEADDLFGHSVDIDDSGELVVVGALRESGSATGIGEAPDNAVGDAGAVYLFVLDTVDQLWSERSYIKSSNSGVADLFGSSVGISADAQTIAAGAPSEAGSAGGISGDASDDSAPGSGAVYLY